MLSPIVPRTLVAALGCALLVALGQIPTAHADTEAEYRAAAEASNHAEIRWFHNDESYVLVRGNQPLFRYLFRSGQKPIVYPLLGPGGQIMSRQYPMQDAEEGETTDHIHQRSMWMTHGEVNGVDFWSERDGSGTIEHRSVETASVDADGVATLVVTADWKDASGKVLLQEHKTFIIGEDEDARFIDTQVKLTAAADEVHFGDTKEGSFGIRIADSMMVDRKTGGTIVNSEGDVDGATWGKRARWVDYSGPVAGQTVGITILDHPASFNAPVRWHVRGYGLFAANPFGESDFTRGPKTDGHRLPAGQTLALHYRVLLHEGGADIDRIERQWSRFVGP